MHFFLPEKRGQIVYSPMVSLFVFIVVAFLAVVMLGGMQYAMHLIYDSLGDIPNINIGTGVVNMTNANEMTFGKATAATDNLTLVSMAIIFSMMMSIVLTNFFIRTHPVMWILYVMITVLAIIFSVPVSNS